MLCKANEAAQLERLRVELLQPGTDLTAKKNEARLLAERLRNQVPNQVHVVAVAQHFVRRREKGRLDHPWGLEALRC